MRSKNIGSEKYRRAAAVAAAIAGLAGLLLYAAAVYVWFTGSHRWRVLGIKIILNEWPVTFWYGSGLILLALLLARREPGWRRPAVAAVTRLGRLVRANLDAPASRWSALGCLLGAMAGYFFAVHYYYLVPNLGLQALAVIVSALVGAGSHLLFALAVAAIGKRLPDPAWTAACLRLAVYVLVWSWLITGPLRLWEARGTEPIFFQAACALAVGLVCAWIFSLDRLRRGRRRPAAVAAVVLALLLLLVSRRALRAGSDPGASPRRVILITMDTTRADYLSCYGYPRPISPNLDRLAASGARFTRAFCQVGITDPSHASILTGAYPRTHGLLANHLAITGKVPSLAEEFFASGYFTAAISSREHVLPSTLNVPGFLFESAPRSWMLQTSAPEAYRRAANLLARHRDEDLFLWIHFFDPHQTYDRHPGYLEIKVDNPTLKGGADYLKPGEGYSLEDIRGLRQLYAGEIYYMDYWLGRLLDHLAALPGPPALVVATADHGEILGEFIDRPIHFGFGHGPVYNAGVHVPLIFAWPGVIPPGQAIADIAESVDIAPTLVDLVFRRPFPGQGMSLRPTLLTGAPTDQRAIVEGAIKKNRPDPVSALIVGNLKLLATSARPVELYDLDRDFSELTDLIPSRPEEAARLFTAWRQWLAATPVAKPEERPLSPDERRNLKALGYVDD